MPLTLRHTVLFALLLAHTTSCKNTIALRRQESANPFPSTLPPHSAERKCLQEQNQSQGCVELDFFTEQTKVSVGELVDLKGFASGVVKEVEFFVANRSLGKVPVRANTFSTTYAFPTTGSYEVEVVAWNADHEKKASASYTIHATSPQNKPDPQTPSAYAALAEQLQVYLQAQPFHATGFGNFEHLRNVSADQALTAQEGQRLFFDGILPQAQDKMQFVNAVREGTVPRYGSAQCAVTTSSVIEHAALKASLPQVAAIFAKARRDDKSDPLSCTDEVEVALKRLGWTYYSKKQFKAPKGAIALEAGRYKACDIKEHSGHIYTILEDLGPTVGDRIADNGGYDHIYKKAAEGFWLPPGVYPRQR